MFKKKETPKNETKPLEEVVFSGDNLCPCGLPATIVSNKGHKFCSLACQTKQGE